MTEGDGMCRPFLCGEKTTFYVVLTVFSFFSPFHFLFITLNTQSDILGSGFVCLNTHNYMRKLLLSSLFTWSRA